MSIWYNKTGLSRVKWCELKNSDPGDQCMVGWETCFGIVSVFWEVESAGLMAC